MADSNRIHYHRSELIPEPLQSVNPGDQLASRIKLRTCKPIQHYAIYAGACRRFVVAPGRDVYTHLHEAALRTLYFVFRGFAISPLDPSERKHRPLALCRELSEYARLKPRILRSPLVVHLDNPPPASEPRERRVIELLVGERQQRLQR